MIDAYEEIHNQIDQSLNNLDGLIIAMRVLVEDGGGVLDGRASEVVALRSLIKAINRSVGEMIEYQGDAWQAMLKV